MAVICSAKLQCAFAVVAAVKRLGKKSQLEELNFLICYILLNPRKIYNVKYILKSSLLSPFFRARNTWQLIN